jgi:acyl carrier protein
MSSAADHNSAHDQTWPQDAAELGVEGTIAALRKLLAERFGMSRAAGDAGTDDALFGVSVGLTSLEGIEFLCEVERRFDLRIKDLDWWVYETPTLAAVARYLVDLSKQKRKAG